MKTGSKTGAALAAALCACALAAQAAAEDPTFAVRSLTPEVALKAAQTALQRCRENGYQVAVAVVDRGGVAQVMLRDRFAGMHTPATAIGKAWTALSFRTPTSDMARETQPGKPASGIRNLPQVVMVGGGLTIEGGGVLLGGIGVSGAPGGDLDETCARAGIEAVRDAIEF